MSQADIMFISCAMFGSIIQELLHWYEHRHHLEEELYNQMINSKLYWYIVLAMIISSGFGSWLLFGQYRELSGRHDIQMLIGAAFPLIFKKAYSAIGEKLKLGVQSDRQQVIRSYFS